MVKKGRWQKGEDELRIVIRADNACGSVAAVILPGINRYWRRCFGIANEGGRPLTTFLVVKGRPFLNSSCVGFG